MAKPRRSKWRIVSELIEAKMPHVIVKLAAGRSEQLKTKLAEDITEAVMAGAIVPKVSVSVSIEDVEPKDWVDKVYVPNIAEK